MTDYNGWKNWETWNGIKAMTETFDYGGPYLTIEDAQRSLEEMYATGEVCEGERPCIEKRQRLTRLHTKRQPCYWITLTYRY